MKMNYKYIPVLAGEGKKFTKKKKKMEEPENE